MPSMPSMKLYALVNPTIHTVASGAQRGGMKRNATAAPAAVWTTRRSLAGRLRKSSIRLTTAMTSAAAATTAKRGIIPIDGMLPASVTTTMAMPPSFGFGIVCELRSFTCASAHRSAHGRIARTITADRRNAPPKMMMERMRPTCYPLR